MAWLFSTLSFNTTLVKEGVATVGSSLSDAGLSVCRSFVDHAALPFATFLLRNAESAVKYSLNGEYQRYEQVTTQSFYSTLSWLQLSDFQIKLVWEFFLIILGNSFLVLIAWWWYGDRIRTHFMLGDRRLRNIEELRVSYSELKLPQEMDFKFK